MAPRNNPLNIPIEKIHGTTYDNTETGAAAFAASVREMAVARERDRVAANARRERGDYGIELSAAAAALSAINRLAYPDNDHDAATDVITRAIRYGFDGSAYVADHLDETVEAFNTYLQDMGVQVIALAEAAYTIRNGKESTDA
jgi:hypothetical protein